MHCLPRTSRASADRRAAVSFPAPHAVVACTLVLLLAGVASAAPDPVREGASVVEQIKAGQLKAALEQLTPLAGRDARVASLATDIRRYIENRNARLEQRAAQLELAMTDLKAHLAADRLRDALVSAIDAHSLSDDPASLLKRPPVTSLMNKAVAAAEAAEAKGDWVEARSLYSALHLLDEVEGRFRDRLQRVQRKVRVLRYYNPDRLVELLEAQRKRDIASARAQGEEIDESAMAPIRIGDETWRQRLQGVQVSMLRQGLVRAAREHVYNLGYGPLVAGGVRSLRQFAAMPSLAEVFPSIKDARKVRRFNERLDDLARRIDERRDRMLFLDASGIIDEVLAINAETLALPKSVVIFEFADGLTSELDDFSEFIWPAELEAFRRNTTGQFFGVGIQISLSPVDGRLMVVSPLSNTPAYRAGVKPGDIIAEVNGEPTTDWGLEHAVREITGPEGTEVTLGIDRPGKKKIIPITLERARIPIESIKGWSRRTDDPEQWDHLIDPVFGIGYVRLAQFLPQSASDLDRAINQLDDDVELEALVLDLRFNPGGVLRAAVEVTNRFLPRGRIVSTIDGRGRQRERYDARPHRAHRDFPVIILINQGSASAAEIVSGALQDHGRAVIVGERSFGKGSVQDVSYLDGNAAELKLTTHYYELPSRRIIHREPKNKRWGIEPDVAVRMTEEEVSEMIRLRQDLDVLRNGETPAPTEGEGEEAPATDPSPLLTDSLDPQLEMAVIVAKARLLEASLERLARQND